MTSRERWTVYPLLFLSLGLAVRANRYFAILHGFITLAICLLDGLAVLEAWGVDSFDWIATPIGRRIVGSVVSSLLVIAIAAILVEMVSSVIERYLARGENEKFQAREKQKAKGA